jgi:aldehyde dehydrogenase (NAD+)
MELARRLRSGMTAVNSVISFAGIPALPFGGIGDSGFGRIHGPEGLKEFSYAHAITRQRMKPLLALTTFARTEKDEQRMGKMIAMLHGRGSTLPK